MEEVFEPAKNFRTKYRADFLKVAEETFDNYVNVSGVDVEENRKTVSKIYSLQLVLDSIKSRINWLYFWVFILLVVMIAAGMGLVYNENHSLNGALFNPDSPKFWLSIFYVVLIIVSLYLMFAKALSKLNVAKQERDETIRECNNLEDEGWAQMAPLNRLFDWDVTLRMVTKAVPKIQFDPFFTEGRLEDLSENYNWDGEFNSDKSVLMAHSGEINGNPFVLGRTLTMKWGQKTYVGTRVITYRVKVGKNSYLRTETLHASVTMPYPEYYEETFLLYGNDAAPHLVFFRKNSGLANDEESFWGKMKKKSTLKDLKKFSRNLKDESQYTMVGNTDFEVLFNTKNRNDEVEFRLLFSSLAQQQMVSLLRNSIDGYGDDFSFYKNKKLNVIHAKHLDDLDLDQNPERYKSFDLKDIRQKFISYNTNYFRALFFGFAPLLVIPLYQQMRSHKNIYGSVDSRHSCFWEHETLANFYGYKKFAPKNCATQCILKTERDYSIDENQKVSVTAYGYKAERRVAMVNVLGGDLRLHAVAVPWEEYLPVSKTSSMYIKEDLTVYNNPEMNPLERIEYIKEKMQKENSVFRRSIISKLKR